MRACVGVLGVLLVLAVSPRASAAQLTDSSTGQSFGVEQKVGGASYTCLGAGVRKFVVVKIYAVAFCLDSAVAATTVKEYVARAHPGVSGEELADALEDDPKFFEALQDAPGNKLVIMKLVHEVTKEKMAEAFRDSLSPVLSAAKIDQLIGAIAGDAREGQRIQIYSVGNSLTIELDGAGRKLEDAEIARKLWRVWLGPRSVTPSLKDSLAAHAAGQ